MLVWVGGESGVEVFNLEAVNCKLKKASERSRNREASMYTEFGNLDESPCQADVTAAGEPAQAIQAQVKVIGSLLRVKKGASESKRYVSVQGCPRAVDGYASSSSFVACN